MSLAYLIGFGTDFDVNQSLDWATKSGFKGSQNAGILHELITETYINDQTSDAIESSERYTRIIRDGFRKLDIDYLDAIPATTTLTFEELKRVANDHVDTDIENELQTQPAAFYLAHYAVRRKYRFPHPKRFLLWNLWSTELILERFIILFKTQHCLGS